MTNIVSGRDTLTATAAGTSLGRMRLLSAVAAAVALSGWAPVASAEQKVTDVAPKSVAQLKQFPGAPKVRISTHGNLLQFEGPVGFDHIGVGDLSEGYVLCYGAVNAYDTGRASSASRAPSVASCGATCTVTRNTSDGKLQLKQVISRSTALRSATFEMTVKNLTGGPITNVILRRQADFDVDTGGAKGTGNFNNWFGAGERDSAFAWNPINASGGEGHAIQMVAVEPTRAFAKVTTNILDTTCNPPNIAAAGPVFGDRGVTLQYNIGNLAGGASVKNTIKYLRD